MKAAVYYSNRDIRTEDVEDLPVGPGEVKVRVMACGVCGSDVMEWYRIRRAGKPGGLIMELVEGPTLADRLAQGALPLDEVLSLAKQIAEALEEAHEKGIVHRDLKPQNVKASIEGRAKVLDFGLAKAMEPAGSASSSPPSAADVAR